LGGIQGKFLHTPKNLPAPTPMNTSIESLCDSDRVCRASDNTQQKLWIKSNKGEQERQV